MKARIALMLKLMRGPGAAHRREATYTYAQDFEFAIGVENLFDTYPDPEGDPVLNFLGVRHSLTSPFGFNGRFAYGRFTARF